MPGLPASARSGGVKGGFAEAVIVVALVAVVVLLLIA